MTRIKNIEIDGKGGIGKSTTSPGSIISDLRSDNPGILEVSSDII